MARGVLLDGVVAELRQLGEQATAAELPLTGLHADVAAARSPIEAAGPASAVIGHSYGGTVITEAAAGLTGVCPGAVLRSIRWPRPRGFYGAADSDPAAAMIARLRPMPLRS